MTESDREAAHYRAAEIAAKAAADQLRVKAAKGQMKSPENAATAVMDAWCAALKKAREVDGGGKTGFIQSMFRALQFSQLTRSGSH